MKNTDFSKNLILIVCFIIIGFTIGWDIQFTIGVGCVLLGIIFLLGLASSLYKVLIIGILAINLNTIRFEIGITDVGLTFRPEHIVFVALLVVWLVSLITRKISYHRTPLDIPIIGYLFANFIATILMSPNKMHSLQECVLIALYAIFYFLTVNILLEFPSKIKSTLKFFIVLGVIHCLYSIVSVFGYAIIGIDIFGLQSTRGGLASGFLQESNLFGIYSACIAIFILAYIFSSKFKNSLTIYTALIMTILALILSATRSAWFAFVFALIVLLVANRHRIFLQKHFSNIVKTISILLLVTTAFVKFGPEFIPNFPTRFHHLEGKLEIGFTFSEGSGLTRKVGWQTAIEKWQDSKLIGRGTMSASVLGIGYAWLWSSFIQTLHDAGLVGLFFMLWIMVYPILFSLKQLRKNYGSFNRWGLSGFIGGCVVLLIACQSSNFLWSGFPWVFYGIGIAMGMNTKAVEYSKA